MAGEFAEIVALTHGYVALGRHSFPVPEPGSHMFGLRLDDQGAKIEGLELRQREAPRTKHYDRRSDRETDRARGRWSMRKGLAAAL